MDAGLFIYFPRGLGQNIYFKVFDGKDIYFFQNCQRTPPPPPPPPPLLLHMVSVYIGLLVHHKDHSMPFIAFLIRTTTGFERASKNQDVPYTFMCLVY